MTVKADKTKRDYVEVVYNEKDRPLTSYPDQLTEYLFKRYQMQPGQRILDMGCGRGEFLHGFSKLGMEAFGVDQSTCAKSINPELEIKTCNMAEEAIPYPDNFFDFIYSKSVVEHFYYPEKIFMEVYRMLKPGAMVVTLTPDWEVIYKLFYEDFTHRTPFTLNSLKDIQMIHGFDEVEVEKFLQLPLVWKYPGIKMLSKAVSLLTPERLKPYSKFIRFSKEVMLLSSARKPSDVNQ